MKNAVYCIAQDRAQAEMIVEGLRISGFSSHEISVLMRDKSGTRDFAHEQNTKLPEGATAGGVVGMGARERPWGGWQVSKAWQYRGSVRLSLRARSWRRWAELQSAAQQAG